MLTLWEQLCQLFICLLDICGSLARTPNSSGINSLAPLTTVNCWNWLSSLILNNLGYLLFFLMWSFYHMILIKTIYASQHAIVYIKLSSIRIQRLGKFGNRVMIPWFYEQWNCNLTQIHFFIGMQVIEILSWHRFK